MFRSHHTNVHLIHTVLILLDLTHTKHFIVLLVFCVCENRVNQMKVRMTRIEQAVGDASLCLYTALR